MSEITPFSREEYEKRFNEMFTLQKQQIELFKQIIEDERLRIAELEKVDILELKDATKN